MYQPIDIKVRIRITSPHPKASRHIGAARSFLRKYKTKPVPHWHSYHSNNFSGQLTEFSLGSIGNLATVGTRYANHMYYRKDYTIMVEEITQTTHFV